MLENDKIILREISSNDTQNILRWRNSEEVKKYFCMQEDLTKESHEWWLENIVKTGEVIQYTIYDKEHDVDLGTVYIRNIDKVDCNGEFGIYIGEPSYRNSGIGKSAMKLICDYAFQTLKLHKIYLRVLESNERAISVYLKNDFQKEGVFKEHVYHPQRGFQNLVFMGKLNPTDDFSEEKTEEKCKVLRKTL